MTIPVPKLKAIILYFCTNTDGRFLGKTKLMKLFYFLDFMHVKKYGSPVTYDSYIHLEHGPIPSTIKNLVDTAADDVDNSILADTISVVRQEGFDLQRIVSKRTFSERDAKYFTESEIEILNEVCNRFGDKNTKYIEDASHIEAPWQKTQLLEEIPYILAAEDDDFLADKEEVELMLKIHG